MSWKFWNTKPVVSLRTRARSSSPSPPNARPASETVPALGWSNPAHSPSRVVLPLPLGPTSASDSPAPSEKDAPRSTVSGPAAVA